MEEIGLRVNSVMKQQEETASSITVVFRARKQREEAGGKREANEAVVVNAGRERVRRGEKGVEWHCAA